MQYSGEGYFGNEASSTTFYASASLVFDLPPYGERKDATASTLTADRVHEVAAAAPVSKKPKAAPKRPVEAAPEPSSRKTRRVTNPTSYAEPIVVDDSEDEEDDFCSKCGKTTLDEKGEPMKDVLVCDDCEEPRAVTRNGSRSPWVRGYDVGRFEEYGSRRGSAVASTQRLRRGE